MSVRVRMIRLRRGILNESGVNESMEISCTYERAMEGGVMSIGIEEMTIATVHGPSLFSIPVRNIAILMAE